MSALGRRTATFRCAYEVFLRPELLIERRSEWFEEPSLTLTGDPEFLHLFGEFAGSF